MMVAQWCPAKRANYASNAWRPFCQPTLLFTATLPAVHPLPDPARHTRAVNRVRVLAGTAAQGIDQIVQLGLDVVHKLDLFRHGILGSELSVRVCVFV